MEKKGRSRLFRIFSLCMIVFLPITIFLTVAYYLFTSPDFYIEVLKGSYLLRAFVEGKNDEMNKRIRDEIEEKVRLDEFAIAAQRSKERFEKAKARFEKVNKTNEYVRAENRLKEIRKSTYEKEGKAFASKKEFEEFREKEIARLRKVLADIESYREANEEEIEKIEDELEIAQREMEQAQEALQEKTDEAQEIIEKHKGTFAGRLNDDMRLLMPVLEPILHEKILDGVVRNQIIQQLDFIRSYPQQKLQGNVYYERKEGEEKSLRIRLPQITISLWVDDAQKGKRHILSDVFVEQIEKVEGLKNRFLFTSIFRLSDSIIAEYLANRFLREHGIRIREGVITMQPLVLEGNAAKSFQMIMLIGTYGKYI
ncbi:MAG: hypothetical protein N2316_08930, partial [Spirochaetes bacterium]|nr:hypothetical protein [Spirochaetota bacterium]